MGHEIIQMNADTWQILDGGVRFFLLTGTKKALLIDIRAAFMRTPSIAEGLGGGNAAISLFPGYLYMC